MYNSAVWRSLQRLIGTWEGTGEGGFPTIDSFVYREVFEVRGGHEDRLLHYQQRTWRQRDSEEFDSHWETGFISVGDDESVEVFNAQGSGRVEVLRGRLEMRGPAVLVDLNSAVLANDERMIGSWRQLRLEADVLDYSMGMSTKQVPDGATHLTGRLTRQR